LQLILEEVVDLEGQSQSATNGTKSIETGHDCLSKESLHMERKDFESCSLGKEFPEVDIINSKRERSGGLQLRLGVD
jgi:hypothetical protein